MSEHRIIPTAMSLSNSAQLVLQSQLFTKPSREVDKEEPSLNAQLLMRAGYMNKLIAGVYSFLPLGTRVLTKIENIIREEMNRLGSLEVLLPALQPKENWEKTGRWDGLDVLFKLKGSGGRDLCLGATHEEVVTPLVGAFINSYRTLPISVYQIQTKFRNEARAKSGLLRGREFRMKDMYSFHTTQADLDSYYESSVDAYMKVFERCGLGQRTYLTAALGGTFSRFSHEFQTVTESGEDIIYLLPDRSMAINREIVDDEDALRELVPQLKDKSELEECKAIEVGNIFKLGTKYSGAFDVKYIDEQSQSQPVLMGCYGLGPTRVMGAIAECCNDSNGLIWPKEVAPFNVHLVAVAKNSEELNNSLPVFERLAAMGLSVLFDDRVDVRPGEKFAESDLIGIPLRIVVSPRTLASDSVEVKSRDAKEAAIVRVDQLENVFR